MIADEDVVAAVEQAGGRLFVWVDPRHCCGGAMTFLETGMAPARDRQFQRYEAPGFELWFDPGILGPPSELHLEMKGRRKKRVAAYWDGCAFAT